MGHGPSGFGKVESLDVAIFPAIFQLEESCVECGGFQERRGGS